MEKFKTVLDEAKKKFLEMGKIKKATIISIFLIILSVLALMFIKTSHTHTWSDATCTEPKTCTQCGSTEGLPLGHDWIAATCTSPKYCLRCNTTEGEALGHSYNGKECTRCYQKDPSYVDLKDVGFRKSIGHGNPYRWIEISGYDYKNNRVTITGYVYEFYNGYYFVKSLDKEESKKNGTVVYNTKYTNDTTQMRVLSNDVCVEDNEGTLTITDRIVLGDRLVIKTKRSGDYSTIRFSKEQWFVPVELLDFSTLEYVKAEGNFGTTVTKAVVNFK